MIKMDKLIHKKESAFIHEFMDIIKKLQPMVWFFKTHGEPMQVRGVPDILMCYHGLFVALEFKIMRGGRVSYSPLQEYTIELINISGGIAVTVWFDNRNGEVGIGTKRFRDKRLAVDSLIISLDVWASLLKDMKAKIKTLEA